MATINEIVGQQAYDDIERLKKELASLADQIKEMATNSKNLELKIVSTADVKELGSLLDTIKGQSKDLANVMKAQADAQAKLIQAEAKASVDRSRAQGVDIKNKEKELSLLTKQANEQKKIADQQTKSVEKINREQEKASKQRIKDENDAVNAFQKSAKIVSMQGDAYEQLRRRTEVATLTTRAFGASLLELKNSGKATEVQLKSMSAEYDRMVKEQNKLQSELFQIENATGGSMRSKNAILVETNQLLREMPNFAISARTGILSLSNNLPMFFDAFSRVSQEMDTATGKTKGWGGALKTVGSALLSWQTILIVAVTLLVQYSDEITDFVAGTSNAEKTQRSLNAALQESFKNYSEQISVLTRLEYAFNKSNVSIEEQKSALQAVKSEYKGVFDGIEIGTRLTESQSNAIRYQIDLLKEKAKQEAASRVLAEANGKLLEAELELAQKLKAEYNGLEETLWDIAEGLFQILPGFKSTYEELVMVENGTIKLTEANHKLLMEQFELYNQGKKSKTQYYQIADAILEIDKKAQGLTETMDLLSGVMSKTSTDWSNSMSNIEISLLNAETNQKKFIRGSKEWIEAGKNVQQYRKQVQLAALDNEFIAKGFRGQQDMFLSEEYVARRNAILQEDVNEFKKATEKKTKTLWDWRNAVMKVNQTILDENTKQYEAEIAQANIYYQSIIDDEKNFLNDRLRANELFYKNEEKLIIKSIGNEFDAINEQRIRIQAIEDKLSSKGISVSNKEELVKLESINVITNAEKDLYATKFSLMEVEETLVKKQTAEIEKIRQDGIDNAKRITESDLKTRIILLQKGFEDSSNEIKKGTNKELYELEKAREKGLITETEFQQGRVKIIKSEGTKVLEAQGKFLDDFLAQQKKALSEATSEEDKMAIQATIDLIEQLWGALARGKGNNVGQWGSISDSLKGALDLSKEEWEKVLNDMENILGGVLETMSSMWDSYYKRREMALDIESEKMQESFKDEENRVKSSLLSESEKEKALEQLNAQRLAQEKRIENERKKIDYERAVREKRMAIAEAQIQASIAAIKVISTASNPLLGIIQSAAIFAQMMMQVARIQATPIPAYEHGTDIGGHKGGLALVGEKRRELVVTPSGELFYTPSNPTLMNLPKGSHVLPNPDAMSDIAKSEALSKIYGTHNSNVGYDSNYLVANEIKDMKHALLGKQENYISLQNGEWVKAIKKGLNKTIYISKI